VSALIVGAIMFGRRRIAERLPSFEVLDDVMHKAIAVGFAFFTIATVLGALWAAEAWGGYWSWDPKETWAAWRALTGLAITSFAFLGVNLFLSGLHSHGEL
jgi:ABC-type transport system involved in cytochrome c biogenesis permease subunit